MDRDAARDGAISKAQGHYDRAARARSSWMKAGESLLGILALGIEAMREWDCECRQKREL